MEIMAADPRGHRDRRTYTRHIVPGSVPDQRRHYTEIMFRPDTLQFSLARDHKNGESQPWVVTSVELFGTRVLKNGQLSPTANQRYSNRYDMTSRQYDNPAPEDVREYVQLIVDSLNAAPHVAEVV